MVRIDILQCDICKNTIPRSEWDQCQDILIIDLRVMGIPKVEDICRSCQLWIIKLINNHKSERIKQIGDKNNK